MSCFAGPNLIDDGLIFYIDPANQKSYSGTGNTINSFNSFSSSIITGTYGYDNTTYQTPVITLNNDSTSSNGQINCNASITANLSLLAASNTLSVMFAAKKNFYGIAGNNNGISQIFQGARNGFTSGWRIYDTNQGTPGSPFSLRHSWGFGFNDIRKSLSISDTQSTTNRMCIVAFTVSSTTLTGFCNGLFATTSNNLQYDNGLSDPRISFTGAGAGSWNGFIGFFAIYNRTLSNTEILQNYNAYKSRFGL
jgi:hypothetical protein